jgi:hypothetical protein
MVVSSARVLRHHDRSFQMTGLCSLNARWSRAQCRSVELPLESGFKRLCCLAAVDRAVAEAPAVGTRTLHTGSKSALNLRPKFLCSFFGFCRLFNDFFDFFFEDLLIRTHSLVVLVKCCDVGRMAAAPEITMSLLMEQLGQTEKEADKVMKAADKGKGKKLVAVLQSLLVSAWRFSLSLLAEVVVCVWLV